MESDAPERIWADSIDASWSTAVLYSYREAGVTIVDHHQASQQFVSHCQREREAGRATPAEWEWINPPLSASVTATYHRNYDPVDDATRPNFVAQEAIQCPFA
ncbi:nitric oxide synthase oxygenase [Streptomyces chartreusis]|uniref:nitric oxide synthase oxygenase n=1 Tax=Streptomyces chartreusis TaxID=1969 RepID=UPI00382E31A8